MIQKNCLQPYFFAFLALLYAPLVNSEDLQGLESYTPIDNKTAIAGKLTGRGSTRMSPILSDWVTLFQSYYTNVTSDIDSQGSETAPDALVDGSANIAIMSRPMNQAEIKEFRSSKGYAPTEILVARDAVVIHVNRLNPLKSLTIPQLDAIFSSTRKCGHASSIVNWESLGSFGDKSIELYLLQKAAGARGLFKNTALCSGSFRKATVDNIMTGDEVVSAVSKSEVSMGFSGVGASNPNTKVIALAWKFGFPAYLPTRKNINSEKYPLSRYLYIYIDLPPKAQMPKLLGEFLRLILSKEGQEIVLNHQAVPLSPQIIGTQIEKLERLK